MLCYVMLGQIVIKCVLANESNFLPPILYNIREVVLNNYLKG